MTLGDLKKKVFKLIEDYSTTDTTDFTDDPDYKLKVNGCINTVVNELAPYTKRATKTQMQVTKDQELVLDTELQDFFLLAKITGVDYSRIDRYVTFNEAGTANIYYFKTPIQIDDETTNATDLGLDYQTTECLAWGVASDILKMDVSNNYGSMFQARYQELKQELDNRISQGKIKIEGGIDV